MPTALSRIQLTETPVVVRALEHARKRWPDAPKSEQIARMLEIANAAVEDEVARRLAERRNALAELREMARDWYPRDYLRDLRADDRE